VKLVILIERVTVVIVERKLGVFMRQSPLFAYLLKMEVPHWDAKLDLKIKKV